MRLIISWVRQEEQKFVEDMFRTVLYASEIKHKDITSDDVILFSGGADISPKIYGESNESTGVDFISGPRKPSNRDIEEMATYEAGLKVGAGMLGVCRGSQLLFALAGGKLFQHVDNHNNCVHYIKTDNVNVAEYIQATSTHHQMWHLYTLPVPFKLIAYTSNGRGQNMHGSDRRSFRYILNKDTTLKDVEYEPEILYIPSTKALLIQGHPEEVVGQHPYRTYCRQLVSDYFLSRG